MNPTGMEADGVTETTFDYNDADQVTEENVTFAGVTGTLTAAGS